MGNLFAKSDADPFHAKKKGKSQLPMGTLSMGSLNAKKTKKKGKNKFLGTLDMGKL